ncbi:preprotein translocase subunit YajC [Schlesneria paludicola]|uniref:preprotein translocase subunit YajC n=1 Tax=Schlesneria paludicola TaxID=360056 RepID=UPI000A061860|nr:preprotein translocase subunit YajC [Schlesneria paludicola]
MNCFSLLLLQADGAAPKNDSFFWVILPPLAIILVLYMVMDSPQRRDKAKRDAMMKNLKKDDRVVTIGGILGSVALISQDGKEVTLKVDDGTRIRFRRTAIAEVLSADTTAEPTKTT